MIKQFIIAGAIGAAGFGVVAASASALPIHTSNNNEGHGRIQQSDQITATCATNPIEFNYGSAATDSTTSTVNVYNIDNTCLGSKIAAVAYDANGHVLGTTKLDTLDQSGYSYNAYGNDIGVSLTFPSAISIQSIDHTVITVSDGLTG